MSLDWIGWDGLTWDEQLWANRAAAFTMGAFFYAGVEQLVGFIAAHLPSRRKKKAKKRGRR